MATFFDLILLSIAAFGFFLGGIYLLPRDEPEPKKEYISFSEKLRLEQERQDSLLKKPVYEVPGWIIGEYTNCCHWQSNKGKIITINNSKIQGSYYNKGYRHFGCYSVNPCQFQVQGGKRFIIIIKNKTYEFEKLERNGSIVRLRVFSDKEQIGEVKLRKIKTKPVVKHKKTVVGDVPLWIIGKWAESRNQYKPKFPTGIIWEFDPFEITGKLSTNDFHSEEIRKTYYTAGNKKFIIYINERLSYEFTLIGENRMNYTPVFFGNDERKYVLTKVLSKQEIKEKAVAVPNWILGRWENKFKDVYHFYENGNIHVSEQYEFTIPKKNIKRQRVKNGNIYIINLKNGKEYKFTLIGENKIDYKPFTFGSNERKYTLVKF